MVPYFPHPKVQGSFGGDQRVLLLYVSFRIFFVGPGPDLIIHKFLRLGAYWKSVFFGNLITSREGEGCSTGSGRKNCKGFCLHLRARNYQRNYTVSILGLSEEDRPCEFAALPIAQKWWLLSRVPHEEYPGQLLSLGSCGAACWKEQDYCIWREFSSGKWAHWERL